MEPSSLYAPRQERWPAFELTGFTKLVRSGGEQYDAVRTDGRWQILRRLGGEEGTIYGIASHDPACAEGFYRYTVGLKTPAERFHEAGIHDGLFTIRVPASEWILFTLEHFARQYGGFWQHDPYEMIQQLGCDFNREAGLHLDLYAPSFVSDDDAMVFAMPVVLGEERQAA